MLHTLDFSSFFQIKRINIQIIWYYWDGRISYLDERLKKRIIQESSCLNSSSRVQEVKRPARSAETRRNLMKIQILPIDEKGSLERELEKCNIGEWKIGF